MCHCVDRLLLLTEFICGIVTDSDRSIDTCECAQLSTVVGYLKNNNTDLYNEGKKAALLVSADWKELQRDFFQRSTISKPEHF